MSNIPEGMREFNLEEALKDPSKIRTRDGRKVLDIYHFKKSPIEFPIYVCIVGDCYIKAYNASGSNAICGLGNRYDLFLISKKKKLYVDIYKNGNIYQAVVNTDCYIRGSNILKSIEVEVDDE